MRVALLFPGQGAQRPGMLQSLPQHPAVDALLAEAAQVLRHDPRALDSPTALESTTAVQLALLIAGCAAQRLLAAEGVTPDVVAGLSVGAFGAAVACGALGFADALRLVRLRGEAMQQAAPPGYGMLALLGLSESGARQLVQSVAAERPLYLASVNGPAEVVVSGEDAALELAAAAAAQRGAASRRLQVALASHCPLMEPVAQRLRGALGAVRLAPPQLPYVSNQRARLTSDAGEIAEDLIVNVARPVLWHDSMTLLHELGCRLYIEVPPGTVLTQLARTAFPAARALACEDTPLANIVRLAQAARGAAAGDG
jgi:malonate decarboxylase epsilon subunit